MFHKLNPTLFAEGRGTKMPYSSVFLKITQIIVIELPIAKGVSYGQYEMVMFYFLSLTCILSQYFVIIIF